MESEEAETPIKAKAAVIPQKSLSCQAVPALMPPKRAETASLPYSSGADTYGKIDQPDQAHVLPLPKSSEKSVLSASQDSATASRKPEVHKTQVAQRTDSSQAAKPQGSTETEDAKAATSREDHNKDNDKDKEKEKERERKQNQELDLDPDPDEVSRRSKDNAGEVQRVLEETRERQRRVQRQLEQLHEQAKQAVAECKEEEGSEPENQREHEKGIAKQLVQYENQLTSFKGTMHSLLEMTKHTHNEVQATKDLVANLQNDTSQSRLCGSSQSKFVEDEDAEIFREGVPRGPDGDRQSPVHTANDEECVSTLNSVYLQ